MGGIIVTPYNISIIFNVHICFILNKCKYKKKSFVKINIL